MKIDGNKIKIGMIINHNNCLLRVIKVNHVKPGKGGAYAQAELKDIINGRKIHERFRSDETLERVTLEQKNCQFSYQDKDEYVFMDLETYEQVIIKSDEIPEDQRKYLNESLNVMIEFHDEKPIGIVIPTTVNLKVVETEAVLKGQTVTSSFKPAILENGVKVMVPQHIDADVVIVVNTEDDTYVEKAK